MLQMLLRRGHLKSILREVGCRILSTDLTYVVRRDIVAGPKCSDAKIPVTFRKAEEEDLLKLIDVNRPNMVASEIMYGIRLLQLLRTGIKTCYVGQTEDGTPCHIRWLIGPDENDNLQAFYKGGYRVLASDEMFVIGAYTPECFRNKGIMGYAMSKTPELFALNGTRWTMAHIHESNIPSLKASRRAGYYPFMLRKETWIAFRRKVVYTPLLPTALFPFENMKRPIRLFTGSQNRKLV